MLIAIITGDFTIVGITITSMFNWLNMNRSEKVQIRLTIREKKEILYLKVIKSLEMPLENQFISHIKKDCILKEESFDIEAQMQLYAPSNILSKYHSAMEAIEADLPYQVKEMRNEELLLAMKKDLRIEEK